MELAELGFEIRRNRQARHLTQAELAVAAGVTRTTVNQLENGVIGDLGIRKVAAILAAVDLTLVPQQRLRTRDFVRLATTAVNVSFKSELTDSELRKALLSGSVPAGRRPHMRMLFEEVPTAIRRGLRQQMSTSMSPGKLERNLEKIASALDLPESQGKWPTND